MTFVQSTSGGGGWPLNCFLTPELKPFFGGIISAGEQIRAAQFHGFAEANSHAVGTRRGTLPNQRPVAPETGGNTAKEDSGGLLLTKAVLTHAATVFKESFDARNGGFGDAPKFPQPSQPSFLLSYGTRFNDPEAVRMVLATCDHMAAGGIHDQLGADSRAIPWMRSGWCRTLRNAL